MINKKSIIMILLVSILLYIIMPISIATSDTSIQSVLNIDTKLENTTFNKSNIHIEGWKLATQADTKINVYIDNKKIDEKYIEYKYKYDLISIVKGYGTYKENPKPNFEIDIPTDNYTQGNHKLKIQFVTEDGTTLKNVENTIYVDKGIKSIINIDTNLNNATFDISTGIHIEGWKLSTVSDTKLSVYIDNKKVDDTYIKYRYKYNLISIVKGYGTYSENPKPNFDIDIPIDEYKQGSHKLKIYLETPNRDILKIVENTVNIDKSTKSILNIDTNLNNTTFNKKGIHIEGWKLATEANTKLNVYIDNKKVDEGYIKYSYKYNLIALVKGYGTYTENPKPNFDINIPIDSYTQGNHKLKIQFVTEDGTVLKSVENTINIDKEIKSILNIDTSLNNEIFYKDGIHIEGWKLSVVKDNRLKIYIDDTQIDEKYITYLHKYDLISIVKGYGTYTENPTPNFDINIPTTNISQGSHKLKIEFVTPKGDILKYIENTIYIEKNLKSVLNIDTDFNNTIFNKTTIHIEGWKLATEDNTKLRVYLNNSRISENYIKYSYKYALTSIVKGYGNSATNPKPNFEIDIPAENIDAGEHSLRIELVTSDESKVLQKVQKTVKIRDQFAGIKNLNSSKYPGYKEAIEKLIVAHPNWNFELLYTGLKFSDAVYGEYSNHSSNLIEKNYGEWVCQVCGSKQYYPGWYGASDKAIAYYMDPRNFLNESNIFQFLDVNEYNEGSVSLSGINSRVNNTFLASYANDINNACKNTNTNPYYVIARLIQENGSKGSATSRGMDGGDGKLYYNPFNINANGSDVIGNALKKAKAEGWDSMQKAIEGGIAFLKKNWLENYQNTLYQNKFDIDSTNGTSLYSHQYMQGLAAPVGEAKTLKSCYDQNTIESNFTFIIPIYEGMSANISPMPSSQSGVEEYPINVMVNTESGALALRNGPSTNNTVIGKLAKGTTLLSIKRGINSDWQEVVTKDGTVGYMSGKYLKQIDDEIICNYRAYIKTNYSGGVNVRTGPSTADFAGFSKIDYLKDYTSVTVIDDSTYPGVEGSGWVTWARIVLDDGRQAFVPLEYVKK